VPSSGCHRAACRHIHHVGARQCRALQPIWHLNDQQYCFVQCVLSLNDANSSTENYRKLGSRAAVLLGRLFGKIVATGRALSVGLGDVRRAMPAIAV
jgi:hypothetical protein